MAKPKKKKVVVRQNWPLVDYQTESGKIERRAIIPLDEIDATQLAAKEELRRGIWARIRDWFKPGTSDADDEGTTELGVGAAIGVSAWGNLYGQESAERLKEENTRLARYADYVKMDEHCVELERAMSITVENVFSSREGDRESYKLDAEAAQIQRILEGVDERVDMQEVLPGVCRGGLKLGDSFEEVVADTADAIVRLKWLNPKQMFRNEDEYGRLYADRAFSMKPSAGVGESIDFQAWQVIHYRHRHQRGSRYGRSFMFSSRRPYRLLNPMEDSLVMNRLTRSTDVLAVTLPLPEDTPDDEAQSIVDAFVRKLKNRRVVDSEGKIDWRRTSLPDNADIVIGQRGGQFAPKAEIKRLGVSGSLGQLEDVKYVRGKLVMSTGTPPSYLGIEEYVNAKATLTMEDVQYCRILRHIQREMGWFQRQVYDRQLIMLDILPEKDLYKIEYPPISFMDEQVRMTIENLKWSIFGQARAAGIPTRWLLRAVLKLTEEEAEEVMTMMAEEPATQPQQPPTGAADRAQEFFRDMRQASHLQTVSELIRTIQAERFHKSMEV